MKKNNKGFTLIELLAVILILGIIALIAIPTVNSILKESRTGAWKSTASQMTKAAENYFQLKQIKNESYVINFTSGQASSGYVVTDTESNGAKDEIHVGSKYIRINPNATETNATAEDLHAYMLSCLSLKGDIPKASEITTFTLDQNGAVALKFENTNARCATLSNVNGEVTNTTEAVVGGTAVCTSK